ncbi:MAG: hypothetical protein NXI31_24250 [bacterium]|nr:hypothetical protein [bacterium]
MSLLAADLRALANLPRAPLGRRLLLHVGIGLGLLALLSWWIAQNVVTSPEVAAMLRRHGGDRSILGLLGMGLLPCPVAATWLGLSLAQRQLFETPELPLWQSAPMPQWRGTIQILLRATFLAVVWSLALSGPFVLTLLQHERAPWHAYALLPLAVATATVPLIAILLVVQIALVRLFASRALRLVLTTLGAAASVGFSTWLLMILFSGSEGGSRFVARAASADSLPWTVDAGAHLLASTLTDQFNFAALQSCFAWLLLATAVFWFGARLHPKAIEAHRLAEPTLRRRRRDWPVGIAATIRKKELAQVLQQPGALIGFLIFAFLVFALVNRQVLVGGILADHRLPLEVRQLSAMLAQWFLATMLVLYPHMGRLVQWEAPQWPLWVTAPASHAAILRGKLEAVGLLLLWPLLLVATVSGHALGASPRTLSLFLIVTAGGTIVALGVLAFVGTLPLLVRPDDSGTIAQGGRGFFASLVLILGFQLGVAPAGFAWIWLSIWARENHVSTELAHDWTGAVLAAGAGWAVLVFAVGFGLAVRNYGKLAAPR